MQTHRIGDDVTVLSDHLEVPGLGFLPVNAFVLHAREPVVVDTGLGLPDRDFVSTLSAVIDPATVRWIFLTHPDRDHTGGIFALLDAAPQAKVVTTFPMMTTAPTNAYWPNPAVPNPRASTTVSSTAIS